MEKKIKNHPMEVLTGKGGIDLKVKDVGFGAMVKAVLKKISKKILSGSFNFGSMQNPAIVSLPQSHLSIIAREYSILIDFIKKMNETEDLVERMRLLTAGFIGNWSYNVYLSKGRGPLNPFLGETYHSKMEDGTEIFIEFVSVKPSTVLV